MLNRVSLAGIAIDGSGEFNECHSFDKSVFVSYAGCTKDILPCDRVKIKFNYQCFVHNTPPMFGTPKMRQPEDRPTQTAGRSIGEFAGGTTLVLQKTETQNYSLQKT